MPGLAGRKPASSGLYSESLVHSPAKPPWSQLTSQVGAGCGSQVTWALPHWKVPRQPRVQRVLFCALQPKVLPCCASQARRQQKPRQGQGHRRLERSWLVVGSDQRARGGETHEHALLSAQLVQHLARVGRRGGRMELRQPDLAAHLKVRKPAHLAAVCPTSTGADQHAQPQQSQSGPKGRSGIRVRAVTGCAEGLRPQQGCGGHSQSASQVPFGSWKG